MTTIVKYFLEVLSFILLLLSARYLVVGATNGCIILEFSFSACVCKEKKN